MLLNLTWLIPGLPIIATVFMALLLFSFSKTMNRLTKPVSFLFIISITLSEIINFILFENDISGKELFFGSKFQLVVDKPALAFSFLIGIIFLLIMLFSVTKLQRRNGYVRYFIFLGLLSSTLLFYAFSGNPFHKFYDPLMSYF